ncbi:MAG TPA: magnesium transporter CorA family protein [Candidatus Saccharimonadales bacterium]|nr:magnesium transporter CorA family protein [Candidatus Saccharimonadales bacterium]
MATIYYSKARERAIQMIGDARKGAWIVVTAPDEAELDQLAKDYDLDRDRLADAVDIYEAPRLEIEGDTLYLFTRYCHPEGKEIATEPLLIIYTPDYLITVQRTPNPILSRLTTDVVDVVTTQKTKTLLQIFHEINRSYQIQLTRISKRLLQIRAQMRQSQISTREFVNIIELEEDLNEFLSALQPQSVLLHSIVNGRYLRLYEDDRDIVEDLERGEGELIELTKSRLRTLTNMRQAYDAIATNNLNNTFKRLTSIAIFLTIPTIVGGLFGMNVALPFQEHPQAFLFVLLIITSFITLAIAIFRRKRWL